MSLSVRLPIRKNRSPFQVFWIVLMITATISSVHGGIYKWRDGQGVTHFSDSPPNAKESMGEDQNYSVLDEDTYVTTEMFVVNNVPEDIFNGRYLPTSPGSDPCIMAFKKEGAKGNSIFLSAVGWGNRVWRWRLSVGGIDYYETEELSQNDYPSRLTVWHSKMNQGTRIRVDMQRKTISIKHGDHTYIYYKSLCDIPSKIYPWVKYDLVVTNAECPDFNGVYTPYYKKKSNAATPRYSKGGAYFIVRSFTRHTQTFHWSISGRSCKEIRSETKDKNLFAEDIPNWKIRERRVYSHTVYPDAPQFEEREDKPYGISISRILHGRCDN